MIKMDEVIRPIGQIDEAPKSKLEAYGPLISWVVYGVGALLVVALISMAVTSYLEAGRAEETQKSWDQIFTAFKDKKDLSTEEKIAIYEGLWGDKLVKGSPAHPYVAMQLAQLHFDLGIRPGRTPALRKKSLENANGIFKKVLELSDWSKNPLYGPIAAEGSALVADQLFTDSNSEEDKSKYLDETIKVLESAVKKYNQRFLYTKLCYQLGRAYWLRSERKGISPSDRKKDRAQALKRLAQATKESNEKSFPSQWKRSAEFLKVLLKKPGSAMPETIPAVRAAKKDDAKDLKDKKDDKAKTEKKADDKKGEKPSGEKSADSKDATSKKKSDVKTTDDTKGAKPEVKQKADAPKADAPKADAPKADAPKADAPKADAPKTDAPKADAPKAVAPKTDAPKTDAPKTEPK